METNEVNGIQNGLSATVRLETVSHLGDGDENTKGREVLLGRLDLGSEGVGRQDVIEQGLRAELNSPGDELGLGVVVESVEKIVPAGLPDVATVESELDGVKVNETHAGQTGRNAPKSRHKLQVQIPKQHRRRRHLI